MANPFIRSSISTAPVGATSPGFGVAALLSYNASAFGSERARSYAGVAEVAADFPSSTGPEQLFATRAFSQSVRPETIMILRGALPPTQKYELAILGGLAAGQAYRLNVAGDGVTATAITVTALADVTISAVANASETFTAVAHGMATGDGPYRLTNSGGGLPSGVAVDTNYWIIRLSADTFQLAASYADAIAETEVLIASDGTGTHTVQRDANDVIVAQLVDRLNSVVGKNYTAVQTAGAGDTDTITVTASAAGEWYSIEVPDEDLALVSIAQTHVDPGVATDLAAIKAAGNGGLWYVLHTAYNSNAYVAAAAAWIAATSDPYRYYHAGSSNSVEATAVVGGAGNSIGDNLRTLENNRTTVFYHTSPAAMIDAGASGRVLPVKPGGIELTAKRLAGVPALNLTTTQLANLAAKNITTYVGAETVATTVGGKTAGGEWWDVVRNDDSVNVDMNLSLFNFRQANDIVGLDDDGIAAAKGVARGVLDRAVKAGIYLDGFVVTGPTAANVTLANRTARRYPLAWAATRRNAIVFIDASGTVSI